MEGKGWETLILNKTQNSIFMKKARLRLASNVWIHGNNSSSSSKVFACSLSTDLSNWAAN
jgi:hypothetical protein